MNTPLPDSRGRWQSCTDIPQERPTLDFQETSSQDKEGGREGGTGSGGYFPSSHPQIGWSPWHQSVLCVNGLGRSFKKANGRHPKRRTTNNHGIYAQHKEARFDLVPSHCRKIKNSKLTALCPHWCPASVRSQLELGPVGRDTTSLRLTQHSRRLTFRWKGAKSTFPRQKNEDYSLGGYTETSPQVCRPVFNNYDMFSQTNG